MRDLGFEAWLDFMFGREVQSEYYPFFKERDAFWDPPPAIGVDYLTRLFENSMPLLRDFSDRQIGPALWLLTSEDAHCLYSQDVPVEARKRCVAAILPLFADLFDPRCAPVLGHLDQPGSGPLNAACYMWWENLPFVAAPDDPNRDRLNAQVVEVMKSVLQLDNPACQESALHGLGHLARHVTGADAAITAYLGRDSISAELTAYAHAARTGCIL
jgi:hypothetical protein